MSNEEFDVGLSHIIVNEANPFKLFDEWFQGAKDVLPYFNLHAMNVATVSTEGRVANRTVLLQDVEEDGFIFNTDRHGRKSKEISDHPQVSATIFWNYNQGDKWLQRQVRIEGDAIPLPASYAQKQFDAATMNHKIRNMLCTQGDVTEWSDLKDRFDKLMEDVKTKKIPVQITDKLIVYKIIPDRMEFYHVYMNEIADRVVFTKSDDVWRFKHTEA